MNWVPLWLWRSSRPLTGILAEESNADCPTNWWELGDRSITCCVRRAYPSCHQSEMCQQLPVETLRPTISHQQNQIGWTIVTRVLSGLCSTAPRNYERSLLLTTKNRKTGDLFYKLPSCAGRRKKWNMACLNYSKRGKKTMKICAPQGETNKLEEQPREKHSS